MNIEHNISMIVNADSSYFDPMSTLDQDKYYEAMMKIEEYFGEISYQKAKELHDTIKSWKFNVDHISMTSMQVVCNCESESCSIVEEIKRLWQDDTLVFDVFYGKHGS